MYTLSEKVVLAVFLVSLGVAFAALGVWVVEEFWFGVESFAVALVLWVSGGFLVLAGLVLAVIRFLKYAVKG